MTLRKNFEQGANTVVLKLQGRGREREIQASIREGTGLYQAKGAGLFCQVLNTKGGHDRIVSRKKLLVHFLIVCCTLNNKLKWLFWGT